MENAILGIGAALAVGLTALGTGLAQSKIGAAGAGTIAEKPELTGTVIILLAIPETMVILGFVIASMIILLAVSYPPINSTTISIAGSLRTCLASFVKIPGGN